MKVSNGRLKKIQSLMFEGMDNKVHVRLSPSVIGMDNFNTNFIFKMYNTYCYIVGFILFLFAFSGCTKTADEIILTDISYMSDLNWEQVQLMSEHEIIITGGEVWSQGVRLLSLDGGNSWEADSVSNKTLISLYVGQDGAGCAGGVDGNFYTFSDVKEGWIFHRLPYWDVIQDMTIHDGKYYLVYGQSFKNGRVLILNNTLEILQDYETDGQLSAVRCTNENCVIAGFGEFRMQTDSSLDWDLISNDPDFYTDLAQIGDSITYACGLGGTILKTKDGGNSWKRIKRGNGIFKENASFTSIDFADSKTGIVVGENGICRITFDGGDTWKSIKGLPKIDFLDVAIANNMAVVVGAFGTIFRIEWP